MNIDLELYRIFYTVAKHNHMTRASEELHISQPAISQSIKKLEEQLEVLLIPKDPNDDKNVVMEIRGAAGGDEANIFAGDLFRFIHIIINLYETYFYSSRRS